MADQAPAQLELVLTPDPDLTTIMHLRAEGLRQRNEKRQDGERLLRPAESIYRLDFSRQRGLQFARWHVRLGRPGQVTITGTSQNWTPDLTHLMTRQLLEPAAIFWRREGSDQLEWNEADAQEFGERLSELARVRRVMYFLITFADGMEPAQLNASVLFDLL
ncbi:olfactory marker protein [Ornithorhynchus anatinus]|uniref:olfactory marker protein n=1 Tax=Ornithorhynchus anatinus TaxID=9258 RepID=UPI0010A819B9|nr:olfactory marker protein [Ornithorhynchus anatinus]